jgi:hypothetical protein
VNALPFKTVRIAHGLLFYNGRMKRTETRPIQVGGVQIGGQNKVIIQSMTNTKTKDVARDRVTLKHIRWVVLVSPWFTSVDCVNVNMSSYRPSI